MNIMQLHEVDPTKDKVRVATWALKPLAAEQLVQYLLRLELEGLAMKMGEELVGGDNGKKD